MEINSVVKVHQPLLMVKNIGTTMAPSKLHHSALESVMSQKIHTNAQTTEVNVIAQVEFTSVINTDLITVMKLPN